MSGTGTEPGTLWVGAILPDPERAVTFYAELFRWETRETIEADSSGQYFSFSLSGRDVAAVGSERGGGAPSVPAWRTYIRAESNDYTVARREERAGAWSWSRWTCSTPPGRR